MPIDAREPHHWATKSCAITVPRKCSPEQFLEAYEMFRTKRRMTGKEIIQAMKDKYGDFIGLRRFQELKRLHEQSIDNGGQGITIDMARTK